MADHTDKFFRNIPGPYYNDHSCIDCDLCRELAPALFRRDDDEGKTFVWRQPVGAEEIKLAEEARSACPTDSIGNDG
ncbi:MAG: ferredoxin [Verrucomicrobiales bacterium]